jgi:hypothetical protein
MKKSKLYTGGHKPMSAHQAKQAWEKMKAQDEKRANAQKKARRKHPGRAATLQQRMIESSEDLFYRCCKAF